ncbi:MAG: HelD family protein [Nakamurella sp.]
MNLESAAAVSTSVASEQIDLEQHYLDGLFRHRDDELQQVHDDIAGLAERRPTESQAAIDDQARLTALSRRRSELAHAASGLCFGRIDDTEGTRTYIGRIGLRAAGADDPMLVDWRAPVARAFYTATAAHPLGLRGRRHLRTTGRTVVGLDDEMLSGAAGQSSGIVGEAALLAALDARRTGSMGDIVATLQREQDDIIRSPQPGCLVVQGGPGTGKTAVALHRAAYLLFSYPRLAERGVLLIGPSTAFLRYIDQVLPSLGETQVVAATVATLLPGLRTSEHDPARAAEVKGRAVWAGILQRAVAAREPAIVDLRLEHGGEVLVVPADQIRAVMTAARADTAGRHQAREHFRAGLLDLLARTVIENGTQQLEDVEKGFESILATVDASLSRERGPDSSPAPSPTAADLPAVRRAIGADAQVAEAVDALWPEQDPQQVLGQLLADHQLLAVLAPELTDADRRAVVQESMRPTAWTVQDIALIDELADLVGAPTLVGDQAGIQPGSLALAAATDRTVAYGHIVVDEAQELSAMQWRMLLRRCPSRSFTVVGDMNQAESPGSPASWEQALEPIFGRALRRTDLTVCYRTPREVMASAATVLRKAGSEVAAPRGVRSTGVQPWERVIGEADLTVQVAQAVDELLARYAGGRVAVIAPAARCPALSEELALSQRYAEDAVVVIDPTGSKGLEFDAVVVVDPHAIARQRRGWNALYVAMTRCTQELGLLLLQSDPLLPTE